MNKPELVAFVHYHLRGGGVTRVIEHAVNALNNIGIRSVVLVGEPPSDCTLDNVIVHEELGYQKKGPASISNLTKELIKQCRSKTGLTPDIWHFHNHSLGKNISIPLLARDLSDNGHHVVFQIHDFSEDGRPYNYQYFSRNLGDTDPGAVLYPLGGRIFYLTLNQRDKRFMIQAGVPDEQISVMPNPVQLPEKINKGKKTADVSFLKSHNELVLYPTRAIRRKNIGEFLLLSAIDDQDALFAITQSPKSPEEQKFYNQWVHFAQKHNLPVAFDFVRESGTPFINLMHSSHHIVTTSITEGFGLAFLEPWLIEKPLFGRNISDITNDFVDEGIDLCSLYNQIEIPIDLIDKDALKDKMIVGLKRSYAAYKQEYKPVYAEKAFLSTIKNNSIDFGRLDEESQMNVMLCILQNNDLRDSLKCYNPSFPNNIHSLIKKNKTIIAEKYNEQVYAERLWAVYDKLLNIVPKNNSGFIPSSNVLMQFLKPERFILLRS